MTTPFPFTAGQVLTAGQLNNISTLIINDKTDSYTLVAGDVGERVIMNKATATTITVPNSVFATGDMVMLANKGAGTCTVTAGAGTTVSVSGSLALAQYGGGTLLALSASTFIFFPQSGVSYGTATGGSSSSISVDGVNYTLLSFTSDGTLTVSTAGLFDFYIVAGGGSGGVGQSNVSGAGGGAGGVLTGTAYFSANQTIDVGAGGSASTTQNAATNGLASVIGSTTGALSAAGGGRGGGHNSATSGGDTNAGNGGSGGGTTYSIPTNLGKSVADTIQGYDGGQGSTNVSVGAAGGGGATAVGGSQTGASTTGAAGGAGVDVSTFIGAVSALYKSGGGGGGGSTGGAGGSSVGGAGGNGSTAGTAAAANTGGGGGGAGYGAVNAGGNGGSGIIYIRFKV